MFWPVVFPVMESQAVKTIRPKPLELLIIFRGCPIFKSPCYFIARCNCLIVVAVPLSDASMRTPSPCLWLIRTQYYHEGMWRKRKLGFSSFERNAVERVPFNKSMSQEGCHGTEEKIFSGVQA